MVILVQLSIDNKMKTTVVITNAFRDNENIILSISSKEELNLDYKSILINKREVPIIKMETPISGKNSLVHLKRDSLQNVFIKDSFGKETSLIK